MTTATRYHHVMPSPVGDITLTGTADAVTGVYFSEHEHSAPVPADSVASAEPFEKVITQLEEYFSGEREEFDVTLAPVGTPFQLQVWDELRRIPYGQTISYGELARRIGKPEASRAVGLANGRNPISIIVPCHRVIGANGKLVGYGGGLGNKAILLNIETRDTLWS